MANYIKLNRKLLVSDTFSNPVTLKIWIWLLLKASWKDKLCSTLSGKGYTDVKIKRGQLVFGRKISSQELNVSESCLYRHIKKLHKMGNIFIISNTHYSIITICNYDSYQEENEFSGQPYIQPTIQTRGQPYIQPTIQDVDTYKESKEGKESKEEIQLVKTDEKKINFSENGSDTGNKQVNTTNTPAESIWAKRFNAEVPKSKQGGTENS